MDAAQHGPKTRRNELAARVEAAFPRRDVQGTIRAVVSHRDVVPAALLARLAPSLSAITTLIEASTNRVVGWIDVGDAEGTDARSVANDVTRRLAPGLVAVAATSASAERPGDADLGFVEITLGPVTARAYLGADALRPVRRASSSRLPSLPIVLEVLCGTTTLDVQSLRELARGDVVTLDVTYREAYRTSVVGIPTPYLLTSDDDGALRVLTNGTTPPMNDTAGSPNDPRASFAAPRGGSSEDEATLDATPSDEALASVRELPVQLVVELARIATTVGELEGLAPGAVLVSGQPLGRSVVLRSNGHLVARGELVDVNGELGVRITETRNQ